MRRMIVLLILMLCSSGALRAQDALSMKLSLKDALSLSQSKPLNVQVADARVWQALAQIDQSKGVLLPQVTAAMNGQRQSRDMRTSGISILMMDNYTGPFNTFDARGKITQTIFDPSTMERLKAARSAHALALTQVQKAREDALSLTAVLYIRAKRACQEVSAVRVFAARDRKIYHVAALEYAQGLRSVVDVKKAKADYYHSRYLLKTAKVQARERRLDLGAMLKIDPQVDIIFDQAEDLDLLTQYDLNQPGVSYDVKAAQDALEFSKVQLKQTQADNWPKITFAADYGRSGASPSKASNTYSVGLMASVPIWLGGTLQAKTKESRAKEQEAQAVYDDAQIQSKAAVIEAQENITKAKALIAAQAAQADSSREQYLFVKEQYANGTAQQIDVLRAKAQASVDEDQYHEALAVLWTSRVSLAKATGQMKQLLH